MVAARAVSRECDMWYTGTVRPDRRTIFALVCATALLLLDSVGISLGQATRAGSPSARAAASCRHGYVRKRVHGRLRCVKRRAPTSTAAGKASSLLTNAIVDSALFPAQSPGEPSSPVLGYTLAFCSTYFRVIDEGYTDTRAGSWTVRAGFSVAQPKGSPQPEPPFDAQGDPQGLLVLGYTPPVSLNVKLEHGAIVSPGYTYAAKWTSC